MNERTLAASRDAEHSHEAVDTKACEDVVNFPLASEKTPDRRA